MPGQSKARSSNMANIQNLPTELLDMIFLLLCQTDRKSIRATCRILERHTTSDIFRRISILFLKTDRDNFFHISNAPHLQPFVRDLVWYECDVNPPHPVKFPRYILDCYPGLHKYPGKATSYADENDACSLVWKLSEAYRASLWWTSKPTSDIFKDEIDEHRALENLEKKRHDSLVMIGQALGRLPNLRTVVSQAMPRNRLLAVSDYPFTADMIRQKLPDQSISHGLLFMLDAIAAFDLSIQNLFWAYQTTANSADSLSHLVGRAFENLRLIDLCRTVHYIDNKHPNIMNLARCLQSSIQLRNLTLCFEKASKSKQFFLRMLPWFDCLIEGSYWPALESLRLAEFWIHEKGILAFLQKHVNSLRRLSLEDCLCYDKEAVASSGLRTPGASWRPLVIGMKHIKGLGLKSLQITQRGDAFLVCESQLLEFIKGGEFNLLHACPEKCLINTVDSVCDDDSWPAYAYSDRLQNNDKHDLEYNGDNESDVGWTEPGGTRYWHLRRKSGVIMYRSSTEPDDDEAYQTEQWLFKHRSGATALGKEPLEYFSDWDSEEGDTIEATPFGPCFDRFEAKNL